MVKFLKINCLVCNGELEIIGHIKHHLHTKCKRCGSDSMAQINSEYDKKRKISGTHTIAVVKRRKFGT